MYVLSFDIGVKNLAYCYFNHDKTSDNTVIHKWDILDVSCSDKSNQPVVLLNKLDKNFSHLDIDYIIIENQPALKNPVMKTIQVVVYTYFQYQRVLLNREFDVHIINARNKIKNAQKLLGLYGCDEIVCKTSPLNKYKWTKEASILYTRQFLECKGLRNDLDFFNSFKKKDDLADTLLQGLYFVQLPSTSEPIRSTNSVE